MAKDGSALRDLTAALARAHVRIGTADSMAAPSRATGWAALDALLPDGGLPHGVVEIACAAPQTRAHAYAGATAIAASVIAHSMQDDRSFSAWIDPARTLHAPGLVQRGIDVHRLLVVRPSPALVGRVAVKVVAAGAFDVVVVDMAEVDGARPSPKREAPELFVRKLALAAETSSATVLLLTEPEKMATRVTPWPVAMRLDVARGGEGLALSIPKERRGRVTTAKVTLPLPALP